MAIERRKSAKSLHEDKDERVRIFRDLCRHCEQGYSLDCFADLGREALETCLEAYKDEFSREKLAEAQRKGRAFWERVGRQQALGECLGNSRSWYYNMANRYGWRERVDMSTESKGALEVHVINYASSREKPDNK